MTKTTRAIAYLRVSSSDQSDNGHSLAAQREKVMQYAALHELEIVEVIEDAGVSAKTLHRPGLIRALDLLKTGKADALLVMKLDRLTRNVRDLGGLIEEYFSENARFALLSALDHIDTRSSNGRLVLNVLASVSQWEREAICERTKGVMQSMKASGRVISRPTLGYDEVVDADGKRRLVSNATEQALIARIVEMRNSGLSYQRVADALNSDRVPTKRGASSWSAMTVKGVCDRVAG